MDFKHFYSDFIIEFKQIYGSCVRKASPVSLYDPINYVLEHPGKQIRPAILVATALNFKDIPAKDLYPAACCVEMIHNFTLVHDDIMDNDLLRHGMETVHAKWSVNDAILSGDGLFAIALQQLDHYSDNPKLYSKLVPKVLHAVTLICEGQAQDMDFENRDDVTLDEYLEMVEKKTAHLLSVSAGMGAALAGLDAEAEQLCEKIIMELGIVFQIQDDLLELTSDPDVMGKSLGSDLVNRKKTFPYLFSKQVLSNDIWKEFEKKTSKLYISLNGTKPARKVLEDNFIFDRIGEVITLRHERIQNMISKLPEGKRNMFFSMVEFVMNRKH